MKTEKHKQSVWKLEFYKNLTQIKCTFHLKFVKSS